MGNEQVFRSGREALFLQELDAIERAVRAACRRGRLEGADAEDFGSYVTLKLIDNDYAVLEKFEGRCSFAMFIGVVVQRLLLDYRIALWGKWHASAEAKRHGELGITIEAMLVRDAITLDEALPALRRRWPELTREQVEAVATRLPQRTPKARLVGADALENVPTPLSVDEMAFEEDRVRLSRRLAEVIRSTLDCFSEDDRLLFRLHFEGSMSIADVHACWRPTRSRSTGASRDC